MVFGSDGEDSDPIPLEGLCGGIALSKLLGFILGMRVLLQKHGKPEWRSFPKF
jgi:hypothetical protein